MTIKNKEQRVGVFIDIQNLYHSAKNLYNARVNYKELLKTLVAGRKLIRAIAYVVKADIEGHEPHKITDGDHGTRPQKDDSQGEKALTPEASFFDALRRVGIELRMKDIQIFASGAKKADWDVGLAVDAIKMAPKLDAVVIVSGDGDFLPLLEYLKINEGCQVEVAAFSRSANAKIKEVADEFVPVEDIPKILIKKNY
ncbi:MAG: NYN domain-containing protein [Candidatus Harrisonbacteria bacterium]|nr:NYN domain-containing protein [Candidatus Harrisonbacteria bacterium]MBI2406300.1 NYN domain-containing protein [Candidatus Harrisonbacteria bacterium]MBI2604359.1 NYN domain-containing protein [Candidatus Harrisonbacteria bacterium]